MGLWLSGWHLPGVGSLGSLPSAAKKGKEEWPWAVACAGQQGQGLALSRALGVSLFSSSQHGGAGQGFLFIGADLCWTLLSKRANVAGVAAQGLSSYVSG